MSADLFVWDPSIGLSTQSTEFFNKFEQLKVEEPLSEPTQAIRDFVSILLSRYPDLTDGIGQTQSVLKAPDGSEWILTDQAGVNTIWTAGPILSFANGGSINLSVHPGSS